MSVHMQGKSFMFLNHEIKIIHKNSISKTHPLTQTGEKPHICLVCNQEFPKKSSLNKIRFTQNIIHIVDPNKNVMVYIYCTVLQLRNKQ